MCVCVVICANKCSLIFWVSQRLYLFLRRLECQIVIQFHNQVPCKTEIQFYNQVQTSKNLILISNIEHNSYKEMPGWQFSRWNDHISHTLIKKKFSGAPVTIISAWYWNLVFTFNIGNETDVQFLSAFISYYLPTGLFIF